MEALNQKADRLELDADAVLTACTSAFPIWFLLPRLLHIHDHFHAEQLYY